MNKDIEKAISNLKMAIKHLDNAEEKAFRSRIFNISDEAERISLEVAKLADELYILQKMVKVKEEGER